MKLRHPLSLVVAVLLLAGVACSTDDQDGSDASSGEATDLPASIQEIMDQPRYDEATWSLLVADVETGETFYSLNPDELSFTGSTRKLFSVGLALDTLGADHRVETPVHRLGEVGADGVLTGDLVLVGAGDLTFGGRRIDADTVDIADFDHNDANGLQTAELTPQDPLYALDDLARQVRDAGITSVSGEVAVDDRLFEPYRVPNGDLLISPLLLNENMVDVTVEPTTAGEAAALEYRPRTEAFTVTNEATTSAPGSDDTLELSDEGLIECLGTPGCSGSVGGEIPVGYEAPLSGDNMFVRTFRVEDPDVFMRTAFIEALARNGVAVVADPVAPNPVDVLPASKDYPADSQVAGFESAPYAEFARLVLKVSLNLGANLSLSLFGVEQGADTIGGSLATTGTGLAAAGKVFAKTGTTIMPGEDGETLQLKAQNLAGYIETKSGRLVAYALVVNDAGPVVEIGEDVTAVLEDEAAISEIIYESL